MEVEGLRARKKRARLEAFVDATHRLAAEQGLERVTVEAICAEVGVSVRTFFNYFESKDDAVLGMEHWRLDPAVGDRFAAGGPTGHLLTDMQALITSALDHPPLGKERMERAFELAKDHPEVMLRAYTHLQGLTDELGGLVRRRFGDAADESTVALVGTLLLALAHATFVRWDTAGGDGDVQDHLPSVVAELTAIVAPRA
ncbi:TetR family transcriptional regulator [Cellulomonas pakistanensis]|uniref:TetR family transcriptional regulator n=1 Tax=Cellulomonas pakistanensis TaxID=992287 RepID=A0A919PCU9_9CELL|nr:TetR family transcriptional regulator [Cellulomonas pakistanensis]